VTVGSTVPRTRTHRQTDRQTDKHTDAPAWAELLTNNAISSTNKKLSYRRDSARCANGYSRSSVVVPIYLQPFLRIEISSNRSPVYNLLLLNSPSRRLFIIISVFSSLSLHIYIPHFF